VGIPSDDAGWLELIRAGMPPCWRLLAEGSGGSVWSDGDVVAAIVPKGPDRSVFNSVFYEDGRSLLGSLDEIGRAYDDAGVRAWTVWVPENDTETATGLERAGHVLDAEPRAMGMEITALRTPEPDPVIEYRDELDMPEVARLNEIAYGWGPGEFAAVADAELPDSYAHFALIQGATVGVVATWDHGDDTEILWVATLPEARNRGISRQLMARAIRAAGGRGRLTTTLVATKLGRPVYERIGYRDFGAIQMWERRKPT
jgi:GNAT superfamily N-acetyltransferase